MNNFVKRLLTAAALGASIAVVVVVIASTSGGGSQYSESAPQLADTPQPEPRIVLVSDTRMPAPSPAATRLHALRVSGRMPSRPVAATVLTDEDCAPDARGVSRCINSVRLPSGRTLDLRHPHRMMEVPCLSPGERVTVRAA